ncbi:alpha/beta fold hydrolase [Nonomuraea pusilla]|uniref:alpha/beta fold hydrolase n=1 Tax=Nonomuraea pusilla TaxID=46177 RepID=UPI00332F46F1
MGQISRPAAVLRYEEHGDGPLAVYAHGMLGSRASDARTGLLNWPSVAERTARRVVAYDARGHGESTGRAEPADYLFPALADDLLTLLDEVGDGAPVAGVGASMGTATLLHAALKAPGRFDRLVLTIPPTAWETRPAKAEEYRRLADLIERHGVAEGLAKAAEGAEVPAIFRDLDVPVTLPDVAEDLLPSLLRGAARGDLPAPADLAALTLPVLILAWDTDPAHPVSTAERLREVLPGSTLHISREAADLVSWQPRIVEFLS